MATQSAARLTVPSKPGVAALPRSFRSRNDRKGLGTTDNGTIFAFRRYSAARSPASVNKVPKKRKRLVKRRGSR